MIRDFSKFYFFFPLFYILIVWQVFSQLGIVNQALFSSPSKIAITFYSLFVMQTSTGHSVLLTHIFASLHRLCISLVIALCLGITIGVLMGSRRVIQKCLNPLITVIMPIPGIAWAPIFMLWLGFGNPTLITVGTLAAFFPIVYNASAGIKSVDTKMVWAAESMGANKKSMFLKVLLPSSLTHILTGFKLGLAKGWRTIIATEMIAASLWGLGYMIFDAREYLQPSIIYGGIFVLAVVFVVIEKGVNEIERRTVGRWKQ